MGLLLLAANQPFLNLASESTTIYSVYTTVFGIATAIFALGIWNQTNFGFIGTIATSIFVAVVDSLTLLNVPSIPGIPKSAAGPEILYSIAIIVFLLKKKLEPQKVL